METELYQTLLKLLLESGWSKRKFSENYNIPHAWFIEFMNPDKPFRPLRIKTISLLYNTFGIPYNVIDDYNKWVLKERGV